MTIQVKITPNGRMSLPADLRKRLGLTNGGVITLEEREDGIVLRTTAQAVANAQAIVRRFNLNRSDASVDAFLADRVKESGE